MAKKKPVKRQVEPDDTPKMPDRVWHKVKQPIPWKGEKFDELIGEYTVSIPKKGHFGEYFQHCVRTEDGTYFVTGTVADSLFAHVPPGELVKLRCLGQSKHTNSDGYCKLYELFTANPVKVKPDGEIVEEPTPPAAIPEYKQPELEENSNEPPLY